MGSNGLTEQHLFLGLVVPNLTYEYKQLAQTIYCISVESSSCNEKNLLSVTLQISSSSIQRDSSSILHETVVWKWNSLNFFLKHDSHNIFHPLEQDIFSTGIRLTISCNVQTRQLWSFLFTLETCKICFWKATNSSNFDSKKLEWFFFWKWGCFISICLCNLFGLPPSFASISLHDTLQPWIFPITSPCKSHF